MIHVVELDVRHVLVPLKRAIEHATQYRTETDNVVVRCKLSDGSIGYGEGVPRDYVTGETVETALALIGRSNLNEQLKPCKDFDAAVKLAEGIALAEVPGDHRMIQGNSARCAVELALLDAYGRAFGEPLMNVTKRIAPSLYEPQSRVQYSFAITKARKWKARLYPLVGRLMGFKKMKLKVGIADIDDIRRTRIVRRWAGSKIDIRLDANEAWSPDEVVERIRELEQFNITSVEQPVKHSDVACLKSVRSQMKVPIMLDESLCSMIDAERAVADGTCDLFNLRLSKCGGFIPTLRLAEYAAKHGLGYQLGCQVGETAILSAAGRHFATSVRGIRYLEGSYDRHLVKNPLSREDITFQRGGHASMLVGSGLGVTIEPAKLEAVTVRREVILGG